MADPKVLKALATLNELLGKLIEDEADLHADQFKDRMKEVEDARDDAVQKLLGAFYAALYRHLRSIDWMLRRSVERKFDGDSAEPGLEAAWQEVQRLRKAWKPPWKGKTKKSVKNKLNRLQEKIEALREDEEQDPLPPKAYRDRAESVEEFKRELLGEFPEQDGISFADVYDLLEQMDLQLAKIPHSKNAGRQLDVAKAKKEALEGLLGA